MQQTVRVAAVQAESAWLDLAAGVDKVISLIGEAAAGGARLVAFPETFIPGYPWWIWLDSPAAGMRFVPRYMTSSMTRDGLEMDRIRQAAARHDIYVVLGFSERSGGSLYMAQAFISGEGDLISVRRKLKPTHVERSVFGEVAEHAYWGGARDRLPLAQTDPLAPGDPPAVAGEGMRQLVRGQDNLCLIRSGQDWSDTDGGERRMYLDDVEPVLRAGMDFLRDEGRTVGCYANRYMRVIDNQGDPVDKSFGMSWWHSLADLDHWAKDHPTHKAIFGQAMKYLSPLGPAARLRLYHEITVAAADDQHFEYLGCHTSTGMLRVLPAKVAG